MDDDNINIDHELRGQTEWDDILIKHGIKSAPERVITEDELTSAVAELHHEVTNNNKQYKYQNKSLSELDELDNDTDNKLINEYRSKRIAELKSQQHSNRYGELYHVGEADYKEEVSGASTECTVIVCLFEFSNPSCQILLPQLDKLAKKYRSIKFVRIEAQKAIPNYPSDSCPTTLIYQNTNIVKQYVGIGEFGGLKLTYNTVEYTLGNDGFLGVVYASEHKDNDPRIALHRTHINTHTTFNKNGIRSTAALSSDDSSDDSDSD